jgi:shikimate kinase
MNPVFLTGVKHSGKSTLAKQVALILRVPYIDIDEVIEKQSGMTPRALFLARGEDGFNEAELQACRSVCGAYAKGVAAFAKDDGMFAKDSGAIVATGGGLCDNILAFDCVRGTGLVVYLDVHEPVIFKRIFKKAHPATDGSLQNLPDYIARGNPRTEEEAASLFHPVYARRAALYFLFADAVFEPRDAPSEHNATILAELIGHLNDCA